MSREFLLFLSLTTEVTDGKLKLTLFMSVSHVSETYFAFEESKPPIKSLYMQ